MIKEVLLADANDKGCITNNVLPHEHTTSVSVNISNRNKSGTKVPEYPYYHEIKAKIYLGSVDIIKESIIITFNDSNVSYIYDNQSDSFISTISLSGGSLQGVDSIVYSALIDDSGILTIEKTYRSISRENWAEKVTVVYETRDMDRAVVRVKDVINSETDLYKYKYYRPYKVETEV